MAGRCCCCCCCCCCRCGGVVSFDNDEESRGRFLASLDAFVVVVVVIVAVASPSPEPSPELCVSIQSGGLVGVRFRTLRGSGRATRGVILACWCRSPSTCFDGPCAAFATAVVVAASAAATSAFVPIAAVRSSFARPAFAPCPSGLVGCISDRNPSGARVERGVLWVG